MVNLALQRVRLPLASFEDPGLKTVIMSSAHATVDRSLGEQHWMQLLVVLKFGLAMNAGH